MINKILIFCGENEIVTPISRINIKNSVKKKIGQAIGFNILYDVFEFDDDVQIINRTMQNNINISMRKR